MDIKTSVECELCIDEWGSPDSQDDIETDDNIESIKADRRCLGCIEEWGHTSWPDQ